MFAARWSSRRSRASTIICKSSPDEDDNGEDGGNEDGNGEEDGNEDNREVKANGSAGAHVDGGEDFAGERGGGEQGGWKTCPN